MKNNELARNTLIEDKKLLANKVFNLQKKFRKLGYNSSGDSSPALSRRSSGVFGVEAGRPDNVLADALAKGNYSRNGSNSQAHSRSNSVSSAIILNESPASSPIDTRPPFFRRGSGFPFPLQITTRQTNDTQTGNTGQTLSHKSSTTSLADSE